jgi:haloalkane dehalogenase
VLAFRERGPQEAPRGTVLCLHGYPQSSSMWEPVLTAAAEGGWRAIAPDLLGFGDSPDDPPHSWERQVHAVDVLHERLGLGPVVLVMHDWGGLIGLRWACEHPDAVRALVASGTGFFPDGRWHGLARSLRTPGQGEMLVGTATRESLGALLRSISPSFTDAALDEAFKAFANRERRQGQLELYRSGDFAKLARYEGCLAALGVPALLVWGEDDPFAPVAGAHRLQRELPGARLEVVPGTSHFVFDDAPEATAALVRGFLDELQTG